MLHFHDLILYTYLFFQHHLWHLWSKCWPRKCSYVLGTWWIFIQSVEKSPKLFVTRRSFIRDPVDICLSKQCSIIVYPLERKFSISINSVFQIPQFLPVAHRRGLWLFMLVERYENERMGKIVQVCIHQIVLYVYRGPYNH